ncbi:MAG: hypothetical protein IT514_11765 [Burkholderiales bacterium]|nr:hypothetical protein [Burkholderiales bacterium]
MSNTGTPKDSESAPRVLQFPDVSDRNAWRAGSALHVAYLITHGDMSRLRAGYAYLDPGQTVSFSFEERPPEDSTFRHVGYLDEVYFITAGEAELRWKDAVLPVRAGQMAYLSRGERYRLTNVGHERVELAWASVWFTPR